MNKKADDLIYEGLETLQHRGKEYEKKEGERSFQRVATAYNAITQKNLKGSDIALILRLLKDVRLFNVSTSVHHDSIVDGINYTALMGEELYHENSSDTGDVSENTEQWFLFISDDTKNVYCFSIKQKFNEYVYQCKDNQWSLSNLTLHGVHTTPGKIICLDEKPF